MIHSAFFGDGEKNFALTADMIQELERKTGAGVGMLYQRLLAGQFHFADIMETIRLGLIGAGTSPAEAETLVATYARPTPIMEAYQLAADILEVRWSGAIEPQADPAKDASE